MSGNGYAIIRSGVLDHLVRGRLGLLELGVYSVIHLQADFQRGIWWGSAPRLLACAPSGTSIRQVQRALETLREIGFLRPFRAHGQRGNYPVLIDKYRVRTGALSGYRLNAWKSKSWESPFYELVAEDDAERDAEGVAERAPSSVISSQESRIKRKEGAPENGAPVAQANPGPSPFAFTGLHLQVTIRQDRALADAFPWADRQAEYRKADCWVESNPGRRPRKASRFMHTWFSKIPAPSSGANGGKHAGLSDTLRSIASA